MICEEEIRKAIHAIKGDNTLFEIRILSSRSKDPISGYFKDVDKAIECLKKQDLTDTNVYIVLNSINEACYSRVQRDKFVRVKTSTSDADIDLREWILIDLDPIRPKDTSSTQEQIEKALAKSGKIHNFLLEQGFPRPIVGFSGNGYHLLYRIKMMPTKECKELLKQFLQALDELFSDDEIAVDQVNFNESRVCKLYGTMAQKGLNTVERPHRMSKIVKIPDEIIPVDSAYIKKICKIVKPDEVKPSRYNGYTSSNFDIEEWMTKYGLNYTAYSYGTGTKYCLDHCPFNESHTKKDAAIFKRSNGAIAFKCLHNSCADKTWQDVRKLYEPEAYERKQEYQEKRMYYSHNRDREPEPKHLVAKENEPIWLTPSEIIHRPYEQEEIIKTGIYNFDRKFRGLVKKNVTIISGQTGGSKSTLVSQLALNAVDDGHNVAVFSGELSDRACISWMIQQAAGKAFVEPSKWQDYFNVPFKYQEQIASWMDKNFKLYNNKYGYDFNAIEEELQRIIETDKLDLLCLDNLMAFDISDLSRDKYDAQSRFAWRLHQLAMNTNTHIIIVCHPKKPMGLLGLYDISGSSDIVNAVDNIVFVYRNNQNFKNAYKQYFGLEYIGQGTNIWHCSKARFGSVDDTYNDLFYEKETKRLKNEPTESRVYGWKEPDNSKQLSMLDKIDFEEVTVPDEIPFE